MDSKEKRVISSSCILTKCTNRFISLRILSSGHFFLYKITVDSSTWPQALFQLSKPFQREFLFSHEWIKSLVITNLWTWINTIKRCKWAENIILTTWAQREKYMYRSKWKNRMNYFLVISEAETSFHSCMTWLKWYSSLFSCSSHLVSQKSIYFILWRNKTSGPEVFDPIRLREWELHTFRGFECIKIDRKKWNGSWIESSYSGISSSYVTRTVVAVKDRMNSTYTFHAFLPSFLPSLVVRSHESIPSLVFKFWHLHSQKEREQIFDKSALILSFLLFLLFYIRSICSWIRTIKWNSRRDSIFTRFSLLIHIYILMTAFMLYPFTIYRHHLSRQSYIRYWIKASASLPQENEKDREKLMHWLRCRCMITLPYHVFTTDILICTMLFRWKLWEGRQMVSSAAVCN